MSKSAERSCKFGLRLIERAFFYPEEEFLPLFTAYRKDDTGFLRIAQHDQLTQRRDLDTRAAVTPARPTPYKSALRSSTHYAAPNIDLYASILFETNTDFP